MADYPSETLFSLELLVDYVRVNSSTRNGNCPTGYALKILPAVAFRLLDFPTVLVYHVESDPASPTQMTLKKSAFDEGSCIPGESMDKAQHFCFGKGKSCLFKMSLRSLRNHLYSTPLYVMVLDVYPEIPKLVGSCLVSLASTIDDVWHDVKENGMSVPCAHGKKGIYTLCNLMGNSVGWISFGYRLSYLGTSLLPHFPETKVLHTELQLSTYVASVSKSVTDHTPTVRDEKVGDAKSSKELNQQLSEDIIARQEGLVKKMDDVSLSKEVSQGLSDNVLAKQESFAKKGDSVSLSTENHICADSKLAVNTDKTVQNIIMELSKGEQGSSRVSVVAKMSEDNGVGHVANSLSKDEILGSNVYCPPPLYYSQSFTKPSKSDNQHCRVEYVADTLLSEDPECSKKHTVKERRNNDHTMYKAEAISASLSSKKDEPTPVNVGVTLQQLPLLNALLVELSLLNTHSMQTAGVVPLQQLPLLYKAVETTSVKVPEVTKPEAVKEGGQSDAAVPGQRSFSPKLRKSSPTRIIQSHVQKQLQKENKQAVNCKHKQDQIEDSEGGSKKKKLYYGMTNTLRLRLQQTNPDMLIVHERREQYRKKQAEILKEKNAKWSQMKNKRPQRSPAHRFKLRGGHGGGRLYHHNSSIDENVETLIQTSMEKDVLSPLNKQTSFFSNNTFFHAKGNLSKGAHETNCKWATKKSTGLSNAEGADPKILDGRTKIIYYQKNKDSSCGLPDISVHGSIRSKNETESGANNLQIKEINPGFPNTSVEGEDFSIGSTQRSSLGNRYMDESVKSVEYTQYSEDFTSPELTGRCSDICDSPEDVLTSPKSHNSESIGSESDLSKYSAVSKESINAPVPLISAASPVQSLSGIYPATRKMQKNPGVVKAAVIITNSSEVSLRGQNVEHTEDKDIKMTVLTEKHRTTENEFSADLFLKFKSINDQTSFEKSPSLRTSKVSSCLPSNVSDLELSTSDLDRHDESKSDISTIGFANKYKHISELVVNNLTGYTL
ncbi:microtubule-associated protein 10 [Protopterus annectens]|uniref:microtubule-associated protein 10 n=1 Tax=Protopterus annectens TaxID=7888 RepID=UPI001CFB7DDE|nr:microtubule-associated protein 10 [Protopterus annectens]